MIDTKFRDAAPDDLKWPLIVPGSSASGSNNEDDAISLIPLRQYWQGVRDRHLSDMSSTSAPTALQSLPVGWSVVTINISDDLGTLFISRHRRDTEPLVFCLPLDRQGRREGEEDTFTVINALEELHAIIEKSDFGAKNAKDVEGREGRATWWAERRDLDKRLEELLSNIEYCWLGAFKTILNPPCEHSADTLAAFRSRIEKLFKKALPTAQDRKKLPKVRLDDSLLECFSSLPSKCRDEELEDLVYFVLDLYQVHGVQVALAEIDIDQVRF